MEKRSNNSVSNNASNFNQSNNNSSASSVSRSNASASEERGGSGNSSLRLSSETPIAALEQVARRAAILAEAERRVRKPVVSSKRGRRESDLVRTVRNIREALSSQSSKSSKVVSEKPGRFSSAHAILKVYNAAVYEAYEEALRHWTRTGREGRKPSPGNPDTVYVFYASSEDPEQLGSVSIYGEESYMRGCLIRRSGTFFGLPVKKMSIEMGRRPFIDVTFRA